MALSIWSSFWFSLFSFQGHDSFIIRMHWKEKPNNYSAYVVIYVLDMWKENIESGLLYG